MATQGFWPWAGGAVLLGLGTAMVYPTLLAAVSDVAHPDWRASAVGVYRLWRDGGYAVGALLAGVLADLLGMPWAIAAIALLTFASGVVVLMRMYETLPAKRVGTNPVHATGKRMSMREDTMTTPIYLDYNATTPSTPRWWTRCNRTYATSSATPPATMPMATARARPCRRPVRSWPPCWARRQTRSCSPAAGARPITWRSRAWPTRSARRGIT